MEHEVVLCEMQPVGFIHVYMGARAQKHPCHVMGRERNTAIQEFYYLHSLKLRKVRFFLKKNCQSQEKSKNLNIFSYENF